MNSPFSRSEVLGHLILGEFPIVEDNFFCKKLTKVRKKNFKERIPVEELKKHFAFTPGPGLFARWINHYPVDNKVC